MKPGAITKPLVKLPRSPEGCWTWLGQVDGNGIPRKQHHGQPMAARRWLWSQLFGDVPEGLIVYGTCGNVGCINPHHSACGFDADKIRLAAHVTLTPADVHEIKRRRNAGPYEKAALARTLGVDPDVLRAIWRGDHWGPGKRRKSMSAVARTLDGELPVTKMQGKAADANSRK